MTKSADSAPEAALVTDDATQAHPERFDPDQDPGGLIASEHYARYLWAAGAVAGKRVLDAGCGTGYGTQILAAAGVERVVGVDISEEAVSGASSRGGPAEFLVADVHELPFDNGEFDIVTCFELIEHVEGRPDALAELKRVLGSSGFLLLSSPNRDTYPPGNPHHVYEYTPEELGREVGSLFGNVTQYRQDAWLASAIVPNNLGGDLETGRDMTVHVAEREGGTEAFSIVVASDSDLPRLGDRCVLGDPFEVRWWHNRATALEAELDRLSVDARRAEATAVERLVEGRRAAAIAEERVERARAETQAVGRALVELESRRALEIERVREAELAAEALREEQDALRRDHAKAHEIIRAMQATRVWRVGSKWWQIRDRLLRRK